MPKDPSQEFGHPDWYPYRSVCTISTHDMSTLRGWWEEDFQQTQRYYNTMLGHYGAAPAVATPELCEQVVRNHLYSNSILCILSLQDWMAMDGKWRNPNVQEERINVPANPQTLLALPYAPDAGTTDESGKSEREDQRTDRTNRTKRIILSIFIIEKGTHSRCLFYS